MFDFLNGAVQPNLHGARKSGAFPLSIDRLRHADSILSWLIHGKLNRLVHVKEMKEIQYSKFDGVSIRFQPLGFVKFTWCAKSEKYTKLLWGLRVKFVSFLMTGRIH